MDRMISKVVFDPWAERGSVKSGVALVLRVSNVMLLEALEVDETRERMMADLADTSKIRICLPWLWIEPSMAVEFYIVT
jgi:hypothetical protein